MNFPTFTNETFTLNIDLDDKKYQIILSDVEVNNFDNIYDESADDEYKITFTLSNGQKKCNLLEWVNYNEYKEFFEIETTDSHIIINQIDDIQNFLDLSDDEARDFFYELAREIDEILWTKREIED